MHSQRLMHSTLRMLARHRPRQRHDIPYRIMMASTSTLASSGSTPSPCQTQGRFICASTIKKFSSAAVPSEEETAVPETIPVSKRMAELGLCKEGEADRILTEAYEYSRTFDEESLTAMNKIIYLRGQPMLGGPKTLVPSDEIDIIIDSGMPIRLSKRMSELKICSRREAARILKQASECNNEVYLKNLKEVIYLRGKPVMGGAAVKVRPGETHIEIRAGDEPPPVDKKESEEFILVPYADRPWEEIQGDTIVLNKPLGYVSGQEEHQHVPAVRLLTRNNMHLDGFDDETRQTFLNGSALHFDNWKYAGYDLKANSVPKHIRETLDDHRLEEKDRGIPQTLSGYAPAGRLDIDSTGVLIFTRAGIMARRMIEPKSKIAKEYIVKVQPAIQPTTREMEKGLKRLPPPTDDLSVLLKRGNWLFGEKNPLKPLLAAEWLDDQQTDDEWERRISTMRLVLVEGKKRQIRRMCRELLGWHVVDLVRTSVGSVTIDGLPEGKWRPLTQEEVRAMFNEKPNLTKRSTRKATPVSGDELDIASDIVTSESTSELPSEVEVMHAIRRALLKDPERRLPLSRLRKKVQKHLGLDPKKEGMRDKWREYFEQIIDANPEQLIIKGKGTVKLRKWDEDESHFE